MCPCTRNTGRVERFVDLGNIMQDFYTWIIYHSFMEDFSNILSQVLKSNCLAKKITFSRKYVQLISSNKKNNSTQQISRIIYLFIIKYILHWKFFFLQFGDFLPFPGDFVFFFGVLLNVCGQYIIKRKRLTTDIYTKDRK